MRYVIVGSGIAGITAAQTIRQYDSDAKINVFSDEIHPLGLYDRKSLARRLPDGIGAEEEFLLVGKQELAAQNIEINYEEVIRAFPRRKQVLLNHAIRMEYDRLLIACGATPMLVDVPGLQLMGVQQLGSYEDIARIESWIPEMQDVGAVILGNELLGLEMAYALRRRGVPTTIVVEENQLAARYLPETTAQFLEKRLLDDGVTIIYGQKASAFESDDHRVLDAVRLDDGRELPARMGLSTIGVRPSTDWLEDSGLEIDEESDAILVNSRLQTNFEHTYAAGSCAMIEGYWANNWEHAQEQGLTAALNMLGQETTYQPSVNGDLDAKLYDLPFAYFGDVQDEAGNHWTWNNDDGPFAVVRLVDGQITGAILAGTLAKQAQALHDRAKNKVPTTAADLDNLVAQLTTA